MSSGEMPWGEVEGCEVPLSDMLKKSSPSKKKQQENLPCILCGTKMFYQKKLFTHVCMNKIHGVLAYYGPDNCYFTSREDIGQKFLQEGRKFHLIEPEVLQMIGVEP